MKFEIPVHSFIDVITNSSSEVFVVADRQTITAFREIVDKILNAAGSDKKCDDLFRLALEQRDGGYGNYNVLVAHAKDPNSVAAAEAISKLNEAFTPENVGNG